MNKIFHPACLALALATAAAPAQVLQPAQSEIAFTIRQFGVPVEGRFMRFAGQVALDPKNPGAGRVALDIETGSARFGAAETDAEVVKPAWFNAAAFPRATLASTAIRAVTPGKYEVAGRMTIKGIARDVRVPVTLENRAGLVMASGAFVINRLDYRIGEGEWSDTSLVANEVQVKFKLALAGMPAP